MDDLLTEFLTETAENMDQLDQDLVALESNPEDPTLLSNIFRLVHTIKGTCGFLGLPRLEGVAHCAENVLGKIRDGELDVSEQAISLVLQALDKIKELLDSLEKNGVEPQGDDTTLKDNLNAMADGTLPAVEDSAPPEHEDNASQTPKTELSSASGESDGSDAAATSVLGSLFEQLGGGEKLGDICAGALDAIAKDDVLGPLFTPEIENHLRDKMISHYGQLLGGPEPISDHPGGDFALAIQHMTENGANQDSLDSFTRYMQASLVEKGVWGPAVEEITTLIKTDLSKLTPQVKPQTDPPKTAPNTGQAGVPAKLHTETGKTSAGRGSGETALKPQEAQEKQELAAPSSSTIRVSVGLLENLMTMVSEMVLTRNQLMQILRSQPESSFAAPLQHLNLITSELQEGVMKTRMQPIGNAWAKLPRIIRDLSHELGKKIDLEMTGAETELDRQILDLIKDPLTHMVRNSADHGIEDAEERLLADKPEKGVVSLEAFHEGGHIVIKVSDDGRGLDTEKITEKALKNGLVTSAQIAEMNEQQIQSFIMQPGFSTAAAVTSVSGRGVGMDVVKTNIEKIGGTIELFSVKGHGSTFTIKIPLTLAIVSALIVECGGERFAIPQISVLELVRCSSKSETRIESISDTPVLRLRDRLLPLVPLSNLLRLDTAAHPLTYLSNKKRSGAGSMDNSSTIKESDFTDKLAHYRGTISQEDLGMMLAALGGATLAQNTVESALEKILDDPLFKPFGDTLNDPENILTLSAAFTSLLGAPIQFNLGALERLHKKLLEEGLNDDHIDAASTTLYKVLSETKLDPSDAEKIADWFTEMRADILNTGKQVNTGEQNPSTADVNNSETASTEQNFESKFENKFIVVSQVGTYLFGIIVDQVYNTEEIVVKPVAPILRDITLFSGNTILGDGSVIMILDPNGIAAATGDASMSETRAALSTEHADSKDESVSLLVFRAGESGPKAVPLALIARLEEIDLKNIEYSHGVPMVQYRGSLMPLVMIDDSYEIKTEQQQPVIVFADRDRSMGLVVDEIVDIVDEVAKIELVSENDGILGSAIINGTATDMIDTGYYLSVAFKDWFGLDEDAAGYQARRILLIDDSAFFRNLLAPILSVEGYDVTTVENPREALRMCERGIDFDAIVSDIEMPHMSGFEFAEAVRKDTRWSDLPIIALSSHASQEDIERGRQVGFNDYVIKNDRQSLIETLKETVPTEKHAP